MDYAQFLRKIRRYAVVACVSDDELLDRIVLKGGNALDLIYDISVRTSLDLDFSLDGVFDDLDSLGKRLEVLLKQTFREIKLHVFDFSIREAPEHLSDDFVDFWGGYKVRFKLIENEKYITFRDNLDTLRRNAIGVGKNQSTVFMIDISKHEYCEEKVAHYLDGYRVYVYSPEMIIAEKVRAICQQHIRYSHTVQSHRRARARDFIDIYMLVEQFHVDFSDFSFQQLVRKIFEVKRVPLELISVISEQRDFHRDGFASVRDTVHPDYERKLKEFDFYADYVEMKCEGLKPLWNE